MLDEDVARGVVPALLLRMPAPTLSPQWVGDDAMTITVAAAEAERDAYVAHVAQRLQTMYDTAMTTTATAAGAGEMAMHAAAVAALQRDVTAALDVALRLVNAENFNGELPATERATWAAVYTRFGAAHLLQSQEEEQQQHEKHDNESDKTAGAADAHDNNNNNDGDRATVAELRDAYLRSLLATDGEAAYACVRLPGLLLAAVALLHACDTLTTHTNGDDDDASRQRGEHAACLLPPHSIWRVRVHFRHQLCLQRRAHSLFARLARCVDALLALPDTAVTPAQLLEASHVHSYYHRRDLAADVLARAQRLSGLTLREDAMLGVRTRWQQHQQVQSIVHACSATPPSPRTSDAAAAAGGAPRVVMSERDGHDLLDRPRERPDATPASLPPLHPCDKALVLALCGSIAHHSPHHSLTQHRMLTYVERLLVDTAATPFVVQSYLLLTRARLEKRRNRMQERAFMQLTELVDQYSSRHHATTEPPPQTQQHEEGEGNAHAQRHSDCATTVTRLSRTAGAYYYTVPYPAIWQLRNEYADFCFDEGLYKTALDVYTQTQHWEAILRCCAKLDKRRRAETLARQRLRREPHNPLLWVALGEATRDEAHLWHAWQLCGGRTAAPMRALAKLALEREQYEKVVEYFDAAVRVNPVWGGDWFALGYAALRLRRWARGAEAFTRVCQIDADDAYAWNNLASILLRQGELRPAYNAQSQALRNNRRDWRMWQNYLHMAVELRDVHEATNALRVALEVGKRQLHLDGEVMRRFVQHTIAYLRGDIAGNGSSVTGNDDNDDDNADGATRGAAGSLACTDVRASDVARTHIALADVADSDDDDDEAAACAMLQPLGTDDGNVARSSHDDDDAAARASTAAAAAAAASAAGRQRHTTRLRELFARLLDTFVSDPDLYACAATLFAYLDGPLAAYRYRVKELRACQQRPQWQRDAALFARTVTCLQSSLHDLAAAVTTTTTADAAADGDGNKTQQHDEAMRCVAELHDTVRAALEQAHEHMEQSSDYATLRGLADQLRTMLPRAHAQAQHTTVS